jgi:hypothetical protein
MNGSNRQRKKGKQHILNFDSSYFLRQAFCIHSVFLFDVSFHLIFGLPKLLLPFGVQFLTFLSILLPSSLSMCLFHVSLLLLTHSFTESISQSSITTELLVLFLIVFA